MAQDIHGVCFTIEKTTAEKLKSISETKGPSRARIIEKAVEEYLKNKDPKGREEEKKKQLCFYPSDEVNKKLKLVAQEEGRSVSNLVSYIVNTLIKNSEIDE